MSVGPVLGATAGAARAPRLVPVTTGAPTPGGPPAEATGPAAPGAKAPALGAAPPEPTRGSTAATQERTAVIGALVAEVSAHQAQGTLSPWQEVSSQRLLALARTVQAGQETVPSARVIEASLSYLANSVAPAPAPDTDGDGSQR